MLLFIYFLSDQGTLHYNTPLSCMMTLHQLAERLSVVVRRTDTGEVLRYHLSPDTGIVSSMEENNGTG